GLSPRLASATSATGTLRRRQGPYTGGISARKPRKIPPATVRQAAALRRYGKDLSARLVEKNTGVLLVSTPIQKYIYRQQDRPAPSWPLRDRQTPSAHLFSHYQPISNQLVWFHIK